MKFDLDKWKKNKNITNQTKKIWCHNSKKVTYTDWRNKSIYKYYHIAKKYKNKMFLIYRERLVDQNHLNLLLTSGWKVGRFKYKRKTNKNRIWINKENENKIVTNEQYNKIYKKDNWKKGRLIRRKKIMFDVTQSSLLRLQQDLKLKDTAFVYAEGKIMVKTKAKKKLEMITKETGIEPKSIPDGWSVFKIQEVLDLGGLISKYKPKGIDIVANKNIMYVTGKNATEEVAKKIAKETGGTYSKQFNPFLSRGYFRINYYGNVGLCLFTEVEMKKFEQIKK